MGVFAVRQEQQHYPTRKNDYAVYYRQGTHRNPTAIGDGWVLISTLPYNTFQMRIGLNEVVVIASKSFETSVIGQVIRLKKYEVSPGGTAGREFLSLGGQMNPGETIGKDWEIIGDGYGHISVSGVSDQIWALHRT